MVSPRLPFLPLSPGRSRHVCPSTTVYNPCGAGLRLLRPVVYASLRTALRSGWCHTAAPPDSGVHLCRVDPSSLANTAPFSDPPLPCASAVYAVTCALGLSSSDLSTFLLNLGIRTDCMNVREWHNFIVCPKRFATGILCSSCGQTMHKVTPLICPPRPSPNR